MKGYFGVIFTCVIILFSAFFVPITNADWSMYRSDSSRNGVGMGNAELAPSVLWESNITREETRTKVDSWTTPAVVKGVVYICSRSNLMIDRYHQFWWSDVYAFNASNGVEIWDYRMNSSNLFSAPAVVNDVVYFGSDDNMVYALSASNGALIWSSGIPNIGHSSPAVVEGVVYIGGYNGYVYALRAANGDILWNKTAGINVAWSSPAVVNGVVYIGSNDNNFYALNAEDGNQIWKFNANGWVMSSPAVANGVVYISSGDGNVYALKADTGVKLWNFSTLEGRGDSPPAVANGLVFFDSYDGQVYALNASSGLEVWNFTAGPGTGSPPVVVDGIVISVRPIGIYALGGENGNVIWSFSNSSDPFGSEPAVDKGILFFGSDEQVFALGSLLSPSPSIPEFTIWIALAVVIISTLAFAFLRRKRSTCSRLTIVCRS